MCTGSMQPGGGGAEGAAEAAARRTRRKQHGLASFPNAEERKRQEETVFPKNITFSILVPLYNTPEKFLREMIDSVQAQTYRKWELCLADGSDDAHPEVGRICQEYMQNDSRIKYKKIEKNLGISATRMCASAWRQGSISACLTMMIYCIRRCFTSI